MDLQAINTVEEVACYLRVHPRTVRRYVAGGHLVGFTLPGGGHRITRAAVEAMLAPSQVAEPEPAPLVARGRVERRPGLTPRAGSMRAALQQTRTA